MRAKSTSSLLNRLVGCLGVACFLGLALWVGLCVPQETRTPLQLSEEESDGRAGGSAGELALAAGPRLHLEDGKWYISWQTSSPADSLITYGRRDPFDHILAKEQRLVRLHRYPLPDVPFVEFHRFRIMSVGAQRDVVTATCGPGDGPGGALFAETPTGKDLTSPGGGDESATAWTDLDGDGDLDLALARRAGDGTDIRLLRWEDGRFVGGTKNVPLVPGLVEKLSWGDFDADGHRDLVACGSQPRIFLNTGPPLWVMYPADGAFSGVTDLDSAQFCRPADLNSDGLPDVLAVDSSGRIRVLVNSGSARLRFNEAEGSPLSARAGKEIGALCTADFTGDGQIDVLALGDRAVMWRNAEGGFQPVSNVVSGLRASAVDIAGAAVADYDADGDPDLYVAMRSGGGALLENRGSGRLSRATRAGDLAEVTGAVTAAAWADLTGNAYPDLVLGRAGGGIGVLFNGGAGDFVDASGICGFPGSGGEEAREIMLADFSGDSAPDMHLRLVDGNVRLLRNFARGSEHGDFLRVRPLGPRGVMGAEVRLMDPHGSSVLATSRVEPGAGPAECIFGVANLHEAVLEVRFSDGLTVSRRWSREGSPRLLRIGRQR